MCTNMRGRLGGRCRFVQLNWQTMPHLLAPFRCYRRAVPKTTYEPHDLAWAGVLWHLQAGRVGPQGEGRATVMKTSVRVCSYLAAIGLACCGLQNSMVPTASAACNYSNR